jgi:hypothetical protein
MTIATAVAIMMVITAVPLLGSESDAAVGDGRAYSYTIEYDPSLMSSGSAAISLADMAAVYHPSYDGTSTTGYGSWTWDATTGFGPFNSFYGAFDGAHNNAFVGVLDPFDLTHLIDGTDISASMSSYNIMWVLPTVYWSATDGTGGANPTLTLSNDSSAGTAYAHTIDGHTYNYIAIGVYEGYSQNNMLWSVSGKYPTTQLSRNDFRTLADAWTMHASLTVDQNNPAHSMLWNFYQWELYKYCCYALMEDFNSQNTIGNGMVYATSSSYPTGITNLLGPYTGNPGVITNHTTGTSYGRSSVKMFIENAWGGLAEFVDGVVADGSSGLWVDAGSVPTDATSASTYVTYIQQAAPSTGFMDGISTDAQTWGLGTHAGGSATVGLCDYYSTSTNSNRVMTVGGNAYNSADTAVRYGLSNASTVHALGITADNIGSRLAFVFDADILSSAHVTSITPNQSTITIQTPTEISATVSPSNATIPDLVPTVTSGSNIISLGSVSTTGATSSVTVTPQGIGTAVITWSATDGSGVTATQTINVIGSAVTIDVSPAGCGSVSQAQVLNVPYGASVSASGTTLTVNGTAVTATPTTATAQYNYYFRSWTGIPSSGTITGDTTITANFSQEERTYTVTLTVDPSGYGTVSQSSLDVPYGASISASGNTLTIGGTTVTATPTAATAQYTYSFTDWTGIPSGDTVTGNMTITASFSQSVRSYDITWVIDGERTVDQYEYGETPVPPEVPEKEGYTFEGWRPAITEVTGDATYTAYYDREIGQSAKEIIKLVPVLVAIGIVMSLAYTFFRSKGGN